MKQKSRGKINEIKVDYLGRSIKIDKPLVRLIRKKRFRIQITNSKNERSGIITYYASINKGHERVL